MTERRENDFYQTPPLVIRSIIPFLRREPMGKWLDPSAGDGRFAAELGHLASDTFVSRDLNPAPNQLVPVERQDFLAERLGDQGRYGTIITNPPFSLIEDFITMALALRPDRVIFLARLSVLGSVGRYKHIWSHEHYQLSQLITLAPRPSFTGGGNDNSEYAWFCWGDMPTAAERPITHAYWRGD